MKIRFASALLALTLPLCAQDPVAAETESMFYKAFYMEKGQRDFVGAMELYQKFLDKAPEHKLAGEAAKSQFQLLVKTGKTKESEAFKAKYEKLIGNVAATPAPAQGGAAGGEGQRRGGEGRPEGAGAGAGGRGQGGPGGMGGRGAMGALRGTKKITEMTDEELGQLKEGLNGMTRMLDMMRENGQEETADKVEAASTNLKKALEANNKEEAQKALDTLRSSMPQRRGRGEGGGPGGGQGGGPGGGAGGGQGGGRGGNTGGGAGGNSGGGGGNNGGGGGGL